METQIWAAAEDGPRMRAPVEPGSRSLIKNNTQIKIRVILEICLSHPNAIRSPGEFYLQNRVPSDPFFSPQLPPTRQGARFISFDTQKAACAPGCSHLNTCWGSLALGYSCQRYIALGYSCDRGLTRKDRVGSQGGLAPTWGHSCPPTSCHHGQIMEEGPCVS